MKKVKLLDTQINILENLPEQGMGYQIVDLILKNGKQLVKKVVLNSMYLQTDEEIDPREIKEIKLHY